MKNYNKLKLVAVLSAIIFAACTTGPFDEVTPQQSVQTRAWYDDGNDDEDGDDIPDMKDGYGDPWGDDDGDGIVNGVDEDYDWGDGNSGGGNSGGFDVYPFCDFETDALEKELFVILGNGDSTLLETNWNILDPFFSQHEPLCYFPEEYSMVLSIAQLFAYKEVPSTSTFGVTST